jgi:parallel beta-helix repeat protein
MPRVRKKSLILVGLLIFISSISSISSSILNNQQNDNFLTENTKKFENINLKTSASWTFNSIHIDDSGMSGNGTWDDVKSFNWISGYGNSTHPYILENITINANSVGSAITIGNSSVHFIIRNCTVYNSGSSGMPDYDSGIRLSNVSNGIITNCSSYSNLYGIFTELGINNEISDNIIKSNSYGIYLYKSNFTTIIDNSVDYSVIYGITLFGIFPFYSSNDIIKNNTFNGNDRAIQIQQSVDNLITMNDVFNSTEHGIYLYSWCINNSIIDNEIYNSTQTGIYLRDYNSFTLIEDNDIFNNTQRGVYVYRSHNNTIQENHIEDNQLTGVAIATTADQNKIIDNEIINNDYGIMLTRADYGTISGNLIKDHATNGVYIVNSLPMATGNVFSNNIFVSNADHVRDDSGGVNFWNSSKIGNDWDNYNGTDVDFDGIGEAPYNVGIAPLIQDYLPITDITEPFLIDATAAGVGAHNWTWAESQWWCTGSGTEQDPYVIKDLDLNVNSTGDCLTIQNSNVFFEIRDSSISNSGFNDAGIYLDTVQNGFIENNNISFNLGDGIELNDANNITIKNNLITFNDDYGIDFFDSNMNLIIGNKIVNSSDRGISTFTSSNNIFTLNEIINNTNYGVCIPDGGSQLNTLYKNAFINNGLHARDEAPNSWNNNGIGNYWDNHSTGDSFNDGIDDTPYTWIMGGKTDDYPIYGDPRHDGARILMDLSVKNWTYYSTRLWCNGNGSYSNPYVIEGLTIDADNGGNGLDIAGSKNEYFIIKGCTIYNAPLGAWPFNPNAAIKLESIRNGTIIDNDLSNNFGIGVMLDTNSINITIRGNTIDNNYVGIYSNSENNTISDNVIANNEFIGITLFTGADNNIIYSNNVSGTSGTGISGSISSYLNISNNRVINNDASGIYINNCDFSNVTDNISENNTNNGINLRNTDNSTISGNMVQYNNESGIYLDNSNNNDITNNTAINNTYHGISLLDSLRNEILDNKETINGNGFYGIFLENSHDNIIRNNTIKYNQVGIYLNNSNSNIISFNTILGNGIWRVDNGIGNTFSNNDYGQTENGGPGNGVPEPPFPIELIIIIGIVAAIGIVSMIVVKGRKSEPKAATEKRDAKDEKLKIAAPRVKPKKLKTGKAKEETKYVYTPQELQELQETEEEIGVEKREFICVVHKGTIEADNIYLCPKCHTLYCTKCARILKEKGEKCWSCENEIKISVQKPVEAEIPKEKTVEEVVEEEISEPELDETVSDEDKKLLQRAVAIKKFDDYIEQLNTMVQKLDIKFSAGAITQEEYIEKKTMLGEKLGEAMGKRDQLKE